MKYSVKCRPIRTAVLSVFLAASSLAAEPEPSRDVFVFGRDRMAFPNRFVYGKRTAIVRDVWPKAAERREKLGHRWPFRDDVEVGSARSSDLYLRDDQDSFARLEWHSVGFFLKRIESVEQFETVISLLHGGATPVALNAEQLQKIFRRIDAQGPDFPLKIVRRDYDAELIAKGPFKKDGLWLLNFIAIEGPSVVEYKYAIGPDIRVARLYRVLVAFSRPYPQFPFYVPISAPGTRGGPTEYRRYYRATDRLWSFLEAAAHEPELVTALKEGEPIERAKAAGKLGVLPETSQMAVPELKKLLHADSAALREAVRAVESIGPAAKDALPELVALLNTKESPQIRLHRDDVAYAIGAIGPAAVDEIRKMLCGRELWYITFDLLGEIGDEAKAAVPDLIEAIKDRPSKAAEALGDIGPAAAKAVPALRELLRNGGPREREAAAKALGQIGSAAQDAIPELQKARLPNDSRLWDAATKAVIALGGKCEGDLKTSMRLAASKYRMTPEVMCAVDQRFLDALGPADVPELCQLLQDSDANLRAYTAHILSLSRTLAKDCILQLLRLLSDPDENVRYFAAGAMSDAGPAAKAAIPVLLAMLVRKQDCTPEMTARAIAVLGGIGPDAKDAVGPLRELLVHSNKSVRSMAIAALGQIGSGAESALPDLKKIQETEVWPLTDTAYDAIQQIQAKPVPAQNNKKH